MTTAATLNSSLPKRRRPAPELRITRSAERDFEELPQSRQKSVLEALANPFRPERIKRLGSKGGTKLWRIEVPNVRVVIASRPHQHVDFVWRIEDRKDVYRVLDNLDPRIPFTGISIEEFVMKHDVKNNGQKSLIPAGSSPTAAPVAHPATPTAMYPAPGKPPAPIQVAVLGETSGLALLKELSNYIGLRLCDDLAAAQDVLREDLKRIEDEAMGHGEWMPRWDAKESALTEQTNQLAREHEALTARQQGLDGTFVVLSGEIEAAKFQTVTFATKLEAGLVALGAQLAEDRQITTTRLDQFAATLVQSEENTTRNLGSLGNRLDALDRGVSAISRLSSEVVRHGMAIDGLSERVNREIDGLAGRLNAERRDFDSAIESVSADVNALAIHQAIFRTELARRTWSARLARAAAWLRSLVKNEGR
jgi:mRNA-degrading endonuclease RelE of RelBE toxin-antitoxin system